MCEMFLYGGCEGNGNRFSSKEECEELCSAETAATTDVCNQPLRKGPCRAAEQRFVFNSESGQCESFVYGGCRGNENNFLTLRECQERCQPNQDVEVEDICLLKRDSGPCNDAVSQWFYDKQFGECRPFTYGGCRGNGNRFNTQNECEVRCRGKQSAALAENPEKICFLKFEAGPCPAEYRRWYFDSEVGYCKDFIFGGCLGNANNFDSKQECEAMCDKIVPRKPQEPFRVVLVASKRSYTTGDTVEFTCRILTVPEPPEKGFIWFKGTSRIYPTDDPRIDIYENGTLIIGEALPQDSGEYSCAPDVPVGVGVFSSQLAIKVVDSERSAQLIQPPQCIDRTEMVDCKQVGKRRLCTHPWYGQFCCRTCQKGPGLHINLVEAD